MKACPSPTPSSAPAVPSRRLPNYEARPEQLAMADAVAAAIARGEHLMVEAGTGVGKTFAYLVPAIAAACADKECRVVISTHTIGLQEQLTRKDIPFLQQVMPAPFLPLLVKGRGNYLSRRRLRVAQKRGPALLTEPGGLEQLNALGHWTRHTVDGSRSDLEFRPLGAVWEMVESDSGNCMGKQCADFAQCFYFKARKQLHQANVLIVNHALFFTDLMLRSLGQGAGILPKYRVVIFDEAHNLEDVAADHLGLSITRGQAEYLLNRVFQERRGAAHGLLALNGAPGALEQVAKTRRATDEFFNTILNWRYQQERKNSRAPQASESLRVRQAGVVPDLISDEFLKLASHLDQVGSKITNAEEKIEYESAAHRCQDLATRIQAWLGQKLPDQVYWIDGTGERGQRLCLSSAPSRSARCCGHRSSIARQVSCSPAPRSAPAAAAASSTSRRGSAFPSIRPCSSAAPSTTPGRSSCTSSARCPIPRRPASSSRKRRWQKSASM